MKTNIQHAFKNCSQGLRKVSEDLLSTSQLQVRSWRLLVEQHNYIYIMDHHGFKNHGSSWIIMDYHGFKKLDYRKVYNNIVYIIDMHAVERPHNMFHSWIFRDDHSTRRTTGTKRRPIASQTPRPRCRRAGWKRNRWRLQIPSPKGWTPSWLYVGFFTSKFRSSFFGFGKRVFWEAIWMFFCSKKIKKILWSKKVRKK